MSQCGAAHQLTTGRLYYYPHTIGRIVSPPRSRGFLFVNSRSTITVFSNLIGQFSHSCLNLSSRCRPFLTCNKGRGEEEFHSRPLTMTKNSSNVEYGEIMFSFVTAYVLIYFSYIRSNLRGVSYF